MAGIIYIGAVSFGTLHGHSPALSFDAKIDRLLQDLKSRHQLLGDFDEYELVIPPDLRANPSLKTEWEIGLVSSRAFYGFTSVDMGNNWSSLPPSDQYLRKLHDFYVNEIREHGNLRPGWMTGADRKDDSNDARGIVTLLRGPWNDPGLQRADRIPTGLKEDGIHWWLRDRLQRDGMLRERLIALAFAMRQESGGHDVKIYEYCQRGNRVWVAGAYDGIGPDGSTSDGFICLSSDGGKSWSRQYCSNGSPNPMYGIFFSTDTEGYGLALRNVLRSEDGGVSWKTILQSDDAIANLFLIDERRLILTVRVPFYLYLSEDEGVTWEKIPEGSHKKSLEQLTEAFDRKQTHVGGINSLQR